jgi:hypothetical protein
MTLILSRRVSLSTETRRNPQMPDLPESDGSGLQLSRAIWQIRQFSDCRILYTLYI